MHKILDYSFESMTGTCSECGHVPVRKKQRKGHKPYATCKVADQKAKAKSHRLTYDAEKQRWKQIKIVFNLSKEQWQLLFEKQNMACAVCHSKDAIGRGWHIDHDHSCCAGRKSCGKCVRGILCSNCNTALGLLKDNKEILQNAIQYLSS